MPLSEVKARLPEIAEEVATTHERVQVTRNGRDYVVLLAAEDLESLEATLELLSDREAQARVLIAGVPDGASTEPVIASMTRNGWCTPWTSTIDETLTAAEQPRAGGRRVPRWSVLG